MSAFCLPFVNHISRRQNSALKIGFFYSTTRCTARSIAISSSHCSSRRRYLSQNISISSVIGEEDQGSQKLQEGISSISGMLPKVTENELEDVQMITNSYSPQQVARAYRERELVLKRAALLASSGSLDELNRLLGPYLNSTDIDEKILQKLIENVDFTKPLTTKELSAIKTILQKIPRQVVDNHGRPERRASVLIPLCNDNGVASILFECRSDTVRTHKRQVCFPGGMVDESDKTIVQAGLREMQEELGIPSQKTEVLGVLRCNWHEVSDFTGIAITPVIGYIGEIKDIRIKINRDEVSDYFTVKITDLIDEKNWVRRNFSAPVFTGAQPHVIWGLTGYLLDRFTFDVLKKCKDGKT